jgi:hydrogenase maturation protein HypF
MCRERSAKREARGVRADGIVHVVALWSYAWFEGDNNGAVSLPCARVHPGTMTIRAIDCDRVRRGFHVTGQVQGVGFRPFVFGLASDLRLTGFVRNEIGAVRIEIEGAPGSVAAFEHRLRTSPPRLAVLESLTSTALPSRGDERFVLCPSEGGDGGAVALPPDTAPCNACLAEMRDPGDRRYRYPFLNCTQCGPRLTIARGAPYDRDTTTMAAFSMCGECRREYLDPADRRFHAQPIACPTCGPRLTLLATGRGCIEGDPIEETAALLRGGAIVAVKGVGGYHLACDATDPAALQRLRARKRRDDKPFAVMVADLEGARRLCRVDEESARLLLSPARPIVIMPRLEGESGCAPGVAPGVDQLGVMLPCTPLHHLLVEAFGPRPLVMTSGNASDEPIAYDDDAFRRLADIADAFLTHDRPIHARCDDSVVRAMAHACVPVRRSRGYAPSSTRLAHSLRRPTLATGAMLKAAFAFGHDVRAMLSHHIGDLEHLEAYRAYTTAIDQYESLLRAKAERVVHDLHPDYPSTAWAKERAAAHGDVELLAVQHHHAHMASCLTDRGLPGRAIGVIFDGGGHGADGTQWGGEFFVGDCRSFERVAHLAPLPLPGGDRAAREGWRVALAWLRAASVPWDVLGPRVSPARLEAVEGMLERRLQAPATTSAGRLFDAVRWLLAGSDRQTFEGQAAMELEAMARGASSAEPYPFDLLQPLGAPLVVDTGPTARAIVGDLARHVPPSVVARRFHATLSSAIGSVCARIRAERGLEDVVLSGGVFQNALLTEQACEDLRARGLTPHTHRQVPPNDGGIALGQLAHAAALDAEAPCA